jgi:ribosomal RNA assembly protein
MKMASGMMKNIIGQILGILLLIGLILTFIPPETIKNILGKSEKKLKRIKGRIIGRNGEIRKAIERYAECYVSIFGKTVSIIADYENLQIARKAINMLINGMPHHTVLKFLENKYSEKQKEKFKEMYKPEF